MTARIFTGTLNGPDGTTVGRFVKFETAHNLQVQIDLLREGLQMCAQATASEAQRIANDVLESHDQALAIAGSSH